MDKSFCNEIEEMKHLIRFKNSDNVSVINNKPIVEFKTKAADGNTYGIVREFNKFYIKVAPKKDTEVLAEDFQYIGGISGRKNYEYNSYALAAKQFDLKLMSINEAYCAQKKMEIESPKILDADWQISETKEMRQEIDRIKQITNNVDVILNESNESENFTQNHTLPEAPAKNPSKEKVNSPFIKSTVANGDKMFNKTCIDYQNAGEPFNEDGKIDDEDMKSDKNKQCNGNAVYSEKAEYISDNAIDSKRVGSGKVTKVEEKNSKRNIKLTVEQAKAWAKENGFMNEEAMDSDDYTNSTELPFPDVNEGYYDYDDDYDVLHDFERNPKNQISYNDLNNLDAKNAFLKDYGLNNYGESVYYDIFLDDINENYTLSDFGKHPSYRKAPFTTLANKEVSKNGKERDDVSVKGSEPFGKKIGSSSPYDEIVNMLTDAVMDKIQTNSLKKKR